MSINQRLRKSALNYWAINDMHLNLKKEIMALANSPEWQHNQTLVGLLETRANLDEAIAHLIKIETSIPENTAEFDKKLLETKISLSKLLVAPEPQARL